MYAFFLILLLFYEVPNDMIWQTSNDDMRLALEGKHGRATVGIMDVYFRKKKYCSFLLKIHRAVWSLVT